MAVGGEAKGGKGTAMDEIVSIGLELRWSLEIGKVETMILLVCRIGSTRHGYILSFSDLQWSWQIRSLQLSQARGRRSVRGCDISCLLESKGCCLCNTLIKGSWLTRDAILGLCPCY